MMAMDFIDGKYVSRDYLTDIQQRESILSFSFGPCIVLVFSLVPSSKTCLSVATLNHRIKWNNYKVHGIIMAAICPGDATLIFSLVNKLYKSGHNLWDTRNIKTKEEIIEFFNGNIPQTEKTTFKQ
jgi:lichenan operon transcriptional antiterminator